MAHTTYFGKTILPVEGTHTTAGQVGLLLMNIRTTLEKLTENCLPWEGPHYITEEILLPKWTEERFLEVIDYNPRILSPCTVGGKKGGAGGGKKGVLKVSFSSHYTL